MTDPIDAEPYYSSSRTPAVYVERATTAELDLIADWWVDLAREQRAFDSHLSAEANRDLVREAIGRGTISGTVLVARSEDGGDGGDGEGAELLGFVMVSIETGRYEQDVARGVVDNLYVRPEARNRGVGSELLSAAERTLADASVDVVTLDAMAGNEDARRFYRRHGYAPHRIEFEKVLEQSE